MFNSFGLPFRAPHWFLGAELVSEVAMQKEGGKDGSEIGKLLWIRIHGKASICVEYP